MTFKSLEKRVACCRRLWAPYTFLKSCPSALVLVILAQISFDHTHTHTHTLSCYMSLLVSVCACVFVCRCFCLLFSVNVCVFARAHTHCVYIEKQIHDRYVGRCVCECRVLVELLTAFEYTMYRAALAKKAMAKSVAGQAVKA